VNDDDERMRELLSRVGEQPGPALGFTADGIARRCRRIRLARWSAGVAAGLVAAAAITTTVALTANRDVEPATPPNITKTEDTPATPTTTDFPTTTTTTTTTNPTTTS
jgi:hypothetical protein